MLAAPDTAPAARRDRQALQNLSSRAIDALVRGFPWLTSRLPLIFRVARFLSVGLVGLAFDAGVFASLYPHGASAPLARAVSLAVATLVTWYLNRIFTFEPSGRTALAEMLRYGGVALVAQGFNYCLFLALIHATSETHPLACLFASAALTAAFSFTGQSLFAFAKPRGSSSSAFSSDKRATPSRTFA